MQNWTDAQAGAWLRSLASTPGLTITSIGATQARAKDSDVAAARRAAEVYRRTHPSRTVALATVLAPIARRAEVHSPRAVPPMPGMPFGPRAEIRAQAAPTRREGAAGHWHMPGLAMARRTEVCAQVRESRRLPSGHVAMPGMPFGPVS